MTKKITDSQILGQLGVTVVKKLVLEMDMIYEHRGHLEAGHDAPSEGCNGRASKRGRG